ncbi:hypothetical protein GIB67_026059 [Kingdonia uniflora]|uniref:Peroxidase n=1 Tax=Kingdonia uniflora TaxID=39325 RepID=A0A7J7M2V3_9MAGN|nr:hypothetical protein GIB67_026059 [Kingdonia uniflora]
MKTNNITNIVLLVSLLFAFELLIVCESSDQGPLILNFYSKTCSKAEGIVSSIILRRAAANPVLGAKLLRLHFHDCFVRGCDASILLDPVGSNQTEKQSLPNLSLSGFDVIDEIKTEIEKVCPGVVSCADILALAARDSVSIRFKIPLWEVPTGRRDGIVSLIADPLVNLPSPFADFANLQSLFTRKGLNLIDLVALSGAHTIGVAHCGSFSGRLYNFSNTSNTDPTLDPAYANFLRAKCPNPPNSATTVELDLQSSLSFDTRYFNALLQKKGLLVSDAALLTNVGSAQIVNQFQNPIKFFVEFAKSMKKMGAMGVLTGNAGEIRKQCRVMNRRP